MVAQRDLEMETAVDRLQEALTGPDGALRAVDRVEFERLPGGRVRWNLFESGRRIYTACEQTSDLAGWLMATKVLLETALMKEEADAQATQGT